MRTLYLIRHGETPWNRDKIFRGRADVELSETGLQQAARVADAVAALGVERIYASPLSRCRQTAQAVEKATGAPVETLDGLVDIDYGEWTGRPDDEVRAAEPDLYARYETSPESVTFPGGESLAEVQDRAMAAVNIALSGSWTAAALVTHRVVLKLLLMAHLEMPLAAFWRVRLDPCSLSAIEVAEDRRIVTLVNDTCHLRGLAAEASGDF